jgi:hypothetical protein
MAPKGSKAAAVEATPEQIEAKKLSELATRLSKIDIKRADQDFNEFQQQRTTLEYFWTTEKKNLDDKKAELRNKCREYVCISTSF